MELVVLAVVALGLWLWSKSKEPDPSEVRRKKSEDYERERRIQEVEWRWRAQYKDGVLVAQGMKDGDLRKCRWCDEEVKLNVKIKKDPPNKYGRRSELAGFEWLATSGGGKSAVCSRRKHMEREPEPKGMGQEMDFTAVIIYHQAVKRHQPKEWKEDSKDWENANIVYGEHDHPSSPD